MPMRAKTLLLCGLLLGAALLAVAPTAQARNYCTELDSWCPGVLCTWDAQWRTWRCALDYEPPIYCVRECDPEW